MKSKAHKLYFGKLETKPVDLKNLSDVIEKEVVKITEYDELNWLKKLNGIQTIDTSNLVKKNCLKNKNCWNWKENTWS